MDNILGKELMVSLAAIQSKLSNFDDKYQSNEAIVAFDDCGWNDCSGHCGGSCANCCGWQDGKQ